MFHFVLERSHVLFDRIQYLLGTIVYSSTPHNKPKPDFCYRPGLGVIIFRAMRPNVLILGGDGSFITDRPVDSTRDFFLAHSPILARNLAPDNVAALVFFYGSELLIRETREEFSESISTRVFFLQHSHKKSVAVCRGPNLWYGVSTWGRVAQEESE